MIALKTNVNGRWERDKNDSEAGVLRELGLISNKCKIPLTRRH